MSLSTDLSSLVGVPFRNQYMCWRGAKTIIPLDLVVSPRYRLNRAIVGAIRGQTVSQMPGRSISFYVVPNVSPIEMG